MNTPIPDNLIDQLLANVRQEDLSAAQAIKYVDRVLSTFRRFGLAGQDEPSILRILENIGDSYEVLGSLEKAEELFRETLEIAELRQDQIKCADLYWKIGRVCRKRNQWNKALENIQKSRTLYEAAESKKGIGRTLISEGLLQSSLGNYQASSDAYFEAIAIAEDIQDNYLVSDASVNLGILASIQGNFERALRLFENSIPYYEQLNKPLSIARTYHNIGLCQTAQKHWPEALDAYEKSFSIAEEAGDLILTALIYVHKAVVYLSLNDLTVVATYCLKALDICKEVDYPLGIAETYKVLGKLYTQKQDWATARGLLNESLNLCEQYKKPLGIAETQRELGLLYHAQNDFEQARVYLTQALSGFRSLGAQHDVSVTENLIENL